MMWRRIAALCIVVPWLLVKLARNTYVTKSDLLAERERTDHAVIEEAELIVAAEVRRRSQDQHPSQEYPDSHG